MVGTLTKHGDSLDLVIETSVLDLPRATAETPRDITTKGQEYALSPVKDAEHKDWFLSA